MEEMKQLLELMEGFKSTIDGYDKKMKDVEKKYDEKFKAYEEEKSDKLHNELADLSEKMQDLQSKYDDAMLKFKHSANVTSVGTKEDATQTEEYKEFVSYMASGAVSESMEQKQLSGESNPDGGYAMATAMADTIMKRLRESSPMRQICAVQKVKGANAWEEPIEGEEEFEAGWVGERETRGTTGNAKINLVKIPVHEVFAQPVSTHRLLKRAYVNVEDFIMDGIMRRFDRVENDAFINGDGVKKPLGFLHNTATISASGDKTSQGIEVTRGTLGFDGIMDLVGSLEAPYQMNASFLAHRLTLTEIRKLKDQENRYLWQPSQQAGNPGMLLGFPIRMATHMPVPATDAFILAFGDFKQAYKIVDGDEMYMIRDEITDKGKIKFYTTTYCGGALLMDKAIKLFQQS